MTTTQQTRPLHLRIPRPAFEAIEALAHRQKITVDALASQKLVEALEDDSIWKCSACGDVLGRGTPRNYDDHDITRPLCPGEHFMRDWNGNLETMFRVGKARSGRLLDGVEHNAIPVVRG